MKRFLCLLLSLIFIFNCFVISAFAEDGLSNGNGVLVSSITPVFPETKNVTLAVRQTRQLIIDVLPTNAADSVKWSVGNKKIATVSSDGTVTGKKAGKTTVTVASTDGSNKKLTYNVTITERKTGNNLSTTSCSVVNTTKSKYNYGQLKRDLAGLKEKYPYFFDYVSLGKTYDNRNIYEIILGNRNAKKKVFVQATIHGREYINTVLVMAQAEALCANYYTGTYRDKYYSELLENCCLYIVPMANPDGVAISIYGADGIRDETLHAKVVKMCKKYGEGKSSYYKYWKSNARGVDLNRNWDCNWKSKKTVTYACSAGYKGSSPMSEKETKILMNAVETLKPNAVISYHSNGEVIYWDFIQSGALQRKCSDLFKTVKGLTGYVSADNPSANGEKTSDLSPCFGDWVAHIKKTPTLTIETGTATCPMAAKYFPDIRQKNQHVLPAIVYFALNDTAVNIDTLKAISKGFSLTAKQNNSKDFAYQVAYSNNSKFKNDIHKEFSASEGSIKITGLKSNAQYYVRIRTVKKYGLIKIYGRWSSAKKITTKK